MMRTTELGTGDSLATDEPIWAPDMASDAPVNAFDEIPLPPATESPQDDPADYGRRPRLASVQARVDAAVRKIGAGPELSGWCEKFVRTCFGLPAKYATARLAWLDTSKRHDDMEAPAGVPVFWDITSGVNANADHIAISVGGGYCVSTSAGPGRTVAKVSIADLTRKWGTVYRGWSEDYHGVVVHTKATPSSTVTASATTARWPERDLPVRGSHTTESRAAWRTLLARVGYRDDDLDLAMQRWLRNLGYYAAIFSLDGDFAEQSIRALQRFLKKKGLYPFEDDGDRGPVTIKAEIRYLNQQRQFL